MVKIVFFAALIAIASAGIARREAPAAGSPLQELEKHAAEFQKVFSQQLDSLVHSKNTEDIQKVLKEGSDSVLTQLSAFSNSIQGALVDANGKAKEALEQTRANVEKTISELRKSHPEVEQQATALREKLATAVESTVNESKKLAQSFSANVEQTNEQLAPKIKEAYDDFVKQAQEVQKKLHEVANKQ